MLTIHNLAYQGLFPRDVVPRLGLPWCAFTMDQGEFWGRFSFLKAGITASDFITTVSPTLRAGDADARSSGGGLDGVLRGPGRSLRRHPERHRHGGLESGHRSATFRRRYDARNLAGKAACKRALLDAFGFPQGDDALARPIVGMVSRLVAQKGLDLILAAAARSSSRSTRRGSSSDGRATLRGSLRSAGRPAPVPRRRAHRVSMSALAHLVEAGADMFLMPSVFEPCGLNQMYSLRYGTVPIVTAVGGLDDTVQPYTARARHANGFKFHDQSPEALVRTVRQAVRPYHDTTRGCRSCAPAWRADHSWRISAGEYVKVYRRARHIAAERGGA